MSVKAKAKKNNVSQTKSFYFDLKIIWLEEAGDISNKISQQRRVSLHFLFWGNKKLWQNKCKMNNLSVSAYSSVLSFQFVYSNKELEDLM